MQKKGRAGTSRAGKIALYGMMTALAFLLSYVETLIPINLGVPGVKLGLANLASIVSLYLLGAGAAAAIALVRIVLVGFTFGNLSMMLYSLAGAAGQPSSDGGVPPVGLVRRDRCQHPGWCGTQHRAAYRGGAGGGKCESVLLSSGASGSRNGSGGADWASRRNPGKPLKMSGFDKIYVNGSHKSTGCTVTVHMQAFLEPKMP